MNGYCNHCENHCPMDNRLCGRRREEARRLGPERDPHDMSERRYYRPPFEDDRPPFDGEERRHERPPFDGEGPHRGHRGPGFHDGEGQRHGPDFREGRSPHEHPRPDGDMLRQRMEHADLSEFLRLCARLQPQGHVGPARGQALILSILAGRDRISQRELQQLLGIRPGSVSEIVTKLERKGCLIREKGDDRRGNLLSITDAGRAAIPQEADDEDDPFAVLSDEQRRQLTDLLKTLLNHWIDRME